MDANSGGTRPTQSCGPGSPTGLMPSARTRHRVELDMKRMLVLGSLVLVGALSATVAAFQQAPAQPGRQGGAAAGGLQAPPSLAGLTTDKLKDNLYVVRGGGGNTAVFITAEGVTLVDTKIYGWAPYLITRIKEITDK